MMKSDIEIAKTCKMKPITEITDKLGIPSDDVELYGKYKAKINFKDNSDKRGKLILVTAITPTPAGEGKTTASIGLTDSLCAIGKKTAAALREPSLGPVFGVKGGAAGGGYSQIVPMEDINLHFTGDFHAVSSAHNLLAAMVDNHIYQGNALEIDPRTVTWKRVVDQNDRQLRFIVDGIGGKTNGVPREDGYDITAASEVMAILCLASSLSDLKKRLGNIIVGYTYDKKPVKASELNANGAMAALLKDAIKPNIVQTLEGNPVFVHGGPFANIAHGCNSVTATKAALCYSDYVVTEAGFGADLGAEKFFDIKCRNAGLKPDAVVLVATIRALKMHGGVKKTELSEENTEALTKGTPNLLRHASNITDIYGLPVLVAINRFPSDTEKEIMTLKKICLDNGLRVVLSETWAKGSAGGEELAYAVAELCENESDFKFSYDSDLGIKEKTETVVRRIYRGSGVEFSPAALKEIETIEENGFKNLPVCIAKTQYSFSDKAELLCAPENFTVTVRNVKVSAGAGFVVVLTGAVMTMPGLPKAPAAEKIDIDENGNITGLF